MLTPSLMIGTVMHRRTRPVAHAFRYPVFYLQLPLREWARATRGPFSVDRWNLLSVRRRDHGPRDGGPLLPWIQRLLAQRGLPVDGEVVLQTFPRVLGYVFNPVSFWFCHDRDGALIAVLAEVNNTFGGHHAYLLHHPDGAPLRECDAMVADKRLHVSPFCDVEGHYRFRFALGRARSSVRIDYHDRQGELLVTSLTGTPRPWTTRALLGALARMPMLTLGVVARIHWQALRLWLAGVPFIGARPSAPHPLKDTSR